MNSDIYSNNIGNADVLVLDDEVLSKFALVYTGGHV